MEERTEGITVNKFNEQNLWGICCVPNECLNNGTSGRMEQRREATHLHLFLLLEPQPFPSLWSVSVGEEKSRKKKLRVEHVKCGAWVKGGFCANVKVDWKLLLLFY